MISYDKMKIPCIMEIKICDIYTGSAVDEKTAEKARRSFLVADLSRNLEVTDSFLQWPITVNYRDNVFRLLSGAVYLLVYRYQGLEKAHCIVYDDLNNIDEMRIAYADQMAKPSSGKRYQSFLYLNSVFPGENSDLKRQLKIAYVMGESDRQVRKYMQILEGSTEKINNDILNERLAFNKAIKMTRPSK